MTLSISDRALSRLYRWTKNRTRRYHLSRIHLSFSRGTSMGGTPGRKLMLVKPFNGENIKVGDCIVFKDAVGTVGHRIVRIENVNGERRYYTKGDALPSIDPGYRTVNDITEIIASRIFELSGLIHEVGGD